MHLPRSRLAVIGAAALMMSEAFSREAGGSVVIPIEPVDELPAPPKQEAATVADTRPEIEQGPETRQQRRARERREAKENAYTR